MLKEIFYRLKSQPVISGVTIVGTALSILLVMVVVMIQQVKVAPFAPESNRDRMLHYSWISFGNHSWGDIQSFNSNGPMCYKVVKELFYPLETPEAVSAFTVMTGVRSMSVPGSSPFAADVRDADDAYFKVFDFTFIDGSPLTREEFEAGIPLAVIDANVSRRLFGTTAAAGREFAINGSPYRVKGVVKPVSPLATRAYSQVWANLGGSNAMNDSWAELGGSLSVVMLAPDRPGGMQEVRDEFNRRLATYQKSLAEAGWEIINRNRPYTQEKNVAGYGANIEPDEDAVRRMNYLIYTVLLLVPAVNLSSMTNSQLRRRTSEIALRRAFGQTRSATMVTLLWENMIVTLIGGLLGLMLSVVVAFCFADAIFAPGFVRQQVSAVVEPGMLLHWSTFGLALLFCFILNLLSSGLPAWRMSRVNLVDSLRG